MSTTYPGNLSDAERKSLQRYVKTVEESAGICGFDAHKHVKGHKRHLLVDTLGIPNCATQMGGGAHLQLDHAPQENEQGL